MSGADPVDSARNSLYAANRRAEKAARGLAAAMKADPLEMGVIASAYQAHADALARKRDAKRNLTQAQMKAKET